MKPCPFTRQFLPFLLLLSAAGAPFAGAAKWPDINPAELAETKGQVDPEAGAEVLEYSVRIDHSDYIGPFEEHYFRIRIYNELGIEELSKIEVPYERSTRISGLTARTIRPDGSTIELGKRDVRDQEILKAGNIRMRVKSLVPSGLEPGAILEYRYVREPAPGHLLTGVVMQRSLPVRKFVCAVESLAHPTMGMRALFFNCPNKEMKKDKRGVYHLEMGGFPSKKEEPFSPPEIQTFSSILFFYEDKMNTDRKTYWAREATSLHRESAKLLKPAKAVTEAAMRAADPSEPAEARLEKLYDFCRTQIGNRWKDTYVYTAEQRRKLPTNKSPSDTLKNGSGTPEDINLLFAALAGTTGLETRLALVNDRSVMFVSPEFAEPFSVDHKVVAVKVEGEWKLFDPGASYLPFGVLEWENNDTFYVLAAEKDGGNFELLNGPPSGVSARRRAADLKLESDGSLEGTVQMEFTGLWNVSKKNSLDDRSEDERVETVRDELQAFLPRAELSDIKIRNVDSPLGSVHISYRVRVPDYAEATGSRLFVQPAFFQRGQGPMFKAPTREASIVFRYRYTEEDTVRISIPEGFTIEAGASPQSIDMGQVGFYGVTLGTVREGKTLFYKRSFRLDTIGFVAKHYDFIREAFERIHAEDGHLVTFKRKDEPANSQKGE